MPDESEARRLAEEFGRGRTARWDEWAFELSRWEVPDLTGTFAFSWYPTAKNERGRPIRVGGNWPILVDRNTGACRLVQGPTEFSALLDRARAREARRPPGGPGTGPGEGTGPGG